MGTSSDQQVKVFLPNAPVSGHFVATAAFEMLVWRIAVTP
jgi:hypothetical protein